ncbi:methyl-accepting chemotaxis protein [Roseospirillum parvum]|uniref:Methyl-accepting chemotaxis protein (MCP) signalling domain-containing protein n=1 Tax=Roseospirillum parvum TaxID=83401 RepID=A0A1G8C2F5_9PROT|nr:methyl-accepting chemotaxis protein [Roseospirillum parvum]SDH39575.1 Methyl-accepting chemotaxis protein (MCP) signalling domain-containing protein [Roseospirillum parvum]
MLSSSLSKARLALLGVMVLAVAGEAAGVLLGGPTGQSTALVGAGLSLVLAAYALFLLRRTERTIGDCRKVLEKGARGRFEERVLGITEGGDLGAFMHATNDLLDRTDAFVREAAASLEYVRDNKYFRRIISRGMQGSFLHSAGVINAASGAIEDRVKAFGGVADTFEANLRGVVEELGQSASSLSTTSQALAHSSTDASRRTERVRDASAQASEHAAMVAAAAEELHAAITEISGQMGRSNEIAQQATAQAEQTSAQVTKLTEAAQRIGEVVGLITDIANQTNLLALNATIEAARAGEAGKGFAVVAGEVKTLATQTAKATEEIGQHVAAIQAATEGSVQAIGEITRVVGELSAISGAVAAAVEEQNAATQEIARSVQSVSGAVDEVSENIAQVAEAVALTDASAREVSGASSELDSQSGELNDRMIDFMKELKTVV